MSPCFLGTQYPVSGPLVVTGNMSSNLHANRMLRTLLAAIHYLRYDPVNLGAVRVAFRLGVNAVIDVIGLPSWQRRTPVRCDGVGIPWYPKRVDP